MSSVKDPHVVIGVVDFDPSVHDTDHSDRLSALTLRSRESLSLPRSRDVADSLHSAPLSDPDSCTTAVSDAAPCALFTAAPGTRQTPSVMAGSLFCHATIVFDTTSFANMRYALIAKQDVYSFPGTPDDLVLETCAVVACPPAVESADGPASCNPTWDGGAVFASMEIAADFAPGTLLPMLADGTVSQC